MKLTEEQEKERYKKTLDIMHNFEKEFEVMNCSLKEMSDKVEYLGSRLEKYEGKTKLLEEETELDSHFHNRTTTREMARRALVNSTGEANWKSLEEHPTILNIYQSIKDRRNKQEQRIEEILFRFENQPTYNEFVESMKGSSAFMDMKKEISNIWERIEIQSTSASNDRTHANKQDLKIRDKIADIQTAFDTLEFLQGEMRITFDTAIMFLMGAVATMGYEPVADGLREILKKPKVEKDDGKKTPETPESS